jgi:hypothetical protein
MTQALEVLIPIDPKYAEALSDDATRALAGRVVDRVLHRVLVDRLFDLMNQMAAEAAERGLTQEILDEELAAYNAERRGHDASQEA